MDRRGSWMSEIYESNSTVVYRVCMRLLKNTEDAADATQEVFLRAFVSLTAETQGEKARAWLITVARHHCLDVLRRKKRLGKALITLGAEPVLDSEAEPTIVDRNFVRAILSQLRERERQALWQSAVEYRPIGEIGRYLGISYLAAAQLLHRARRRAAQAAARVAVVFGTFQLGRQRPAGASALVARLVAVAAVPLIVVSVQSSSATRQPARLAPVPVSVAAPHQAGGSMASPGIVAGPGSLVPGSTATLNTAAITIGQLLKSLPSIPPVLGKTAPVPLGSATPSPPPIH